MAPIITLDAAETPYLVWDDHMERNASFGSSSDMLIARLRLTHSLPDKTINLLLDVIHNPAFVVSDVTFKSAADIERHLVEQNTELSERRSYAASHPPSVPFTVLELILDDISIERRLVCREERRKIHVDTPTNQIMYNSWTTTLRNLSLVCKAWTSTCQRHLASMIELVNLGHSPLVFNPIRSPYIGSLTHHLYINQRPREGSNSLVMSGKYVDFCTFMAQFPSLRSLAIVDVQLLDTTEFMRILGQLKCLEHFEWSVVKADAPDFSQLCATLNGLPCLRSVYLRGPMGGRDWGVLQRLASIPNRQFPLEELTLSWLPGDDITVQLQCAEWLLRPTDTSIITKLRLYIDKDVVAHILSLLGDLSTLDTLEVMGLPTDVAGLLSQCSSLRTFHIFGLWDVQVGMLLRCLPSTTQVLGLMTMASDTVISTLSPFNRRSASGPMDTSSVEMDSSVSTALRGGILPQLGSLTFWVHSSTGGYNLIDLILLSEWTRLHFTETPSVCHERGIPLHLDYL